MGGVGVAHENLLSANLPFGKKAGNLCQLWIEKYYFTLFILNKFKYSKYKL